MRNGLRFWCHWWASCFSCFFFYWIVYFKVPKWIRIDFFFSQKHVAHFLFVIVFPLDTPLHYSPFQQFSPSRSQRYSPQRMSTPSFNQTWHTTSWENQSGHLSPYGELSGMVMTQRPSVESFHLQTKHDDLN